MLIAPESVLQKLRTMKIWMGNDDEFYCSLARLRCVLRAYLQKRFRHFKLQNIEIHLHNDVCLDSLAPVRRRSRRGAGALVLRQRPHRYALNVHVEGQIGGILQEGYSGYSVTAGGEEVPSISLIGGW